jgi:hypothetical protein
MLIFEAADAVDATSAKLGSQKSASRYNEEEPDAAEVASVVQSKIDQQDQEELKEVEQPLIDGNENQANADQLAEAPKAEEAAGVEEPAAVED